MTSNLIHQRCFNHALREAAARCPECGHFYCRECITEHEDRVICANCLAKLAAPRLMERRGLLGNLRPAQGFNGLFSGCLFFFFFWRGFVSIDSFVDLGRSWWGRWLGSPRREVT